jgi:Domain of unknown function (DUF4389)
MSNDPRPVLELRTSPPDRQRRWTVFFRSLLAIPHFIVLGFVGYAVLVANIFGWFALLFTGRNPVQRFAVGYLRWRARAYAYAWLLSDRYPPFSTEADDNYPVDITLEPGPVSRVTVFFRLILAIPAYVVVASLVAGASIFVFVGWLITLFRGSLPRPLHDAFRATLRFNLRAEAYLYLVQHRYPRGLFGDAARESPEPKRDVVAIESTNGPSVQSVEDIAGHEAASTRPDVESEDSPWSALATSDVVSASNDIALTRGSKRVVVAQLVMGAVAFVGYVVLIASLVSTLSSAAAWYNLNGGKVSTLQLTVSTTIDDIAASPPNWSVIAHDCNQVSSALDSLARTSQYPIEAPNRDLLAGIAEITIADRACVANIAPGHLARYLPQLAHAFASGNSRLNAFTIAVP